MSYVYLLVVMGIHLNLPCRCEVRVLLVVRSIPLTVNRVSKHSNNKTIASSPGPLVCGEGPGNHCMRMYQSYHENLEPCTQAFSVFRVVSHLSGFHGTIGACTCSGYQVLLHVREGLGTRLE